jgi:hypothetical protein
MGSWSVYCGLSNITITSGHRCFLLPLVEKEDEYDNNWKPLCLPIEGNYDDYGSLEYIVENYNTRLIEKHYNVKICDFVNNLATMDELKEPYDNIKYMWIDGEVYDFLKDFYNENPSLFFMGDCNLLEAMGFEFISTNKNDNRYNKIYSLDGKFVKTDGVFISRCKKNGKDFPTYSSIFEFWKLKKIFPSARIDRFKNSHPFKFYKLLNFKKTNIDIHFENLFFGNLRMLDYMDKAFLWDKNKEKSFDYNYTSKERLEIACNILKEITKERYEEFTELEKDIIINLYEKNEEFCDGVADLLCVKANMYMYSKTFSPFINYITPQCGEHKAHKEILKQFYKIVSRRS